MQQFERWAQQTLPPFRFAVKMSWRISHGGDVSLLPTFCERARALGDRLGPIYVKLERARDEGFLALLLDSLDPALGYAFDFDHPTWAEADEVDGALDETGVARIGRLEGTASFRYLRLREPPYDDAALAEWAERIRPLLAGGLDVVLLLPPRGRPSRRARRRAPASSPGVVAPPAPRMAAAETWLLSLDTLRRSNRHIHVLTCMGSDPRGQTPCGKPPCGHCGCLARRRPWTP